MKRLACGFDIVFNDKYQGKYNARLCLIRRLEKNEEEKPMSIFYWVDILATINGKTHGNIFPSTILL